MAGPLRYCDICGQLDDAPRHSILVPVGTPQAVPTPEFLESLPEGPIEAAATVMNTRLLCRHQDCCAAQGCEVCIATEAAHGGVRDDALWASIEAGTVRDLDTDGMGVGGI